VSVAEAARAKALALEAGFDIAGIAPTQTTPERSFFAEWVARGYAGEMAYLRTQVPQRSDLRVAFPWARSVLSVALQYDTPEEYSRDAPPERGWISRYAWGDDYHDVMLRMLRGLEGRIARELGCSRSRSYVDTGPIVERAIAQQAGLGAWGKNTCLLHPEHGSWFFLGEVILDLELAEDAPLPDMCGTCTACLDVCPTDAFPEPYVLDATRCISYLTIELKGAIPETLRPGVGRHVFGCDLCQDVCPWNNKRRHRGPEVFEARPGAHAPSFEDLAKLDGEGFRERFRKSPVKRSKRRGLLRNVAVALGNSADPKHRALLEHLAQDEDPVIREHALWALDRLR
jgi:epoxyqueuosine reductase